MNTTGASRRPIPQRVRRGASALQVVVLLGLAAGAVWTGTTLLNFSDSKSTSSKAIFVEIAQNDFELAITERGEIESSGDVEIRSEVKTKNQPGLAILRIVPEGSEVGEGDFLVELDSSALREERTLQQIAVNTAEALVVEAQNVYETGVIAKREYIEGTFVQERETLESELFVAQENLSRAEEYLKYSKKLAAKGYVNELQLEADTFAVEKAKKEADAAATKLRVLDDFTREKMLKQLESDIRIAEAKWEAEKNSYSLEVDKLQEIDDQVAKCTITAPRAGVVKYAHVSDRRGDTDFLVEEGALVRERQVILRMPDPSQMRVTMTINESLVQFVQPGMPAAIEAVGIGGVVLPGVVESVNQYAEPTGWRKANVKEYKAYVRIDGEAADLRSGMTASVTIRSLFEPNVVQAPVQAIYSHGDQQFCFVEKSDGGLEARVVECGPTNDKFYVIQDGLEPAERVALNPRSLKDEVSLPELDAQEEKRLRQGSKPFARLEDPAEADSKKSKNGIVAKPAPRGNAAGG